MPREYRVGDELVAGFRLSGFLGRGGFGQVWRCQAPGGAELALKIIDLGRKEGLREYRALRLVKRIRHANLVPVVACWLRDDEGRLLEGLAESDYPTECFGNTLAVGQPAELIIAMGLGEKNLLDRLRECQAQGERGIPPSELLDYLEDAARGLDYLNSPRHDLGNGPVAIQHCDVKPQNILIVGAAAQVCDFGLARVLSDTRQTRATVTVAYAAPECIQGNPPSATTDQYSLAISYIELRTGRLPFADDQSAAQILRAHLHGELDLSALSAEEQEVIRRATSLDPGMRYPSALRMVRALRKACGVYPSSAGSEAGTRAAEDLSAPQTRPALQASLPTCKRRRPVLLVAAAVAVLFGSLLWAASAGLQVQAAARWLGLGTGAERAARGKLAGTGLRPPRSVPPSVAASRAAQGMSGDLATGTEPLSQKRRRAMQPPHHGATASTGSMPAVASQSATPSRPNGGSAAAGSSRIDEHGAAPSSATEGQPVEGNWISLVRLMLAARLPLWHWAGDVWASAAPYLHTLYGQVEEQGVAAQAAAAASDVEPLGLPLEGETNVASSPALHGTADERPAAAGAAHGDDFMEQARLAAKRGDLRTAVRLATLAIEQAPNDGALHAERSAWKAAQRDFEGALEDVEQARALMPSGSIVLRFVRLQVRVRCDECPLVSPGMPVVRLPAGTVLVVTRVEGEWLYVESDAVAGLPGQRSPAYRGWIDRDDVESLGQ